MRFTTTIERAGKNATGIPVPDEVVVALGGGKRPPVSVTVNGFTFRTTVGSMGGRAMVPLSAERRTAAGIAGGDTVEIDIELDVAPREIDVPADFAAALDAAPGARTRFDAMAPSHRKEHVRAIEDAKTPETRQRRIDKAITALSEH